LTPIGGRAEVPRTNTPFSTDPDPEPFREVQRLRARVTALEVENQDLKEGLAYA